jgi:hypothetical protein
MNKRIEFSGRDNRLFERAIRAADTVELMKIKHMASREASPGGNGLWLFYLPDFTRIFKDWYRLYINGLVAAYDTGARFKIAERGPWLMLKYRGLRPRQLFEKAISRGDIGYLKQTTEQARREEKECAVRISEAEESLACGKTFDFEGLLAAMTRFAAKGLDSVIPEELIAKRFPFLSPGHLYRTDVSSWDMIRSKALDLLELVYLGKISLGGASESHARAVGCLRWGDIEAHEDDLAYSARLLDGFSRKYSDLASITEYREHRAFDRRMAAAASLAAPAYASRKNNLLAAVVSFTREAQRYNEQRRILFTRTLRITRDLCVRLGLDWRSVALAEVSTTAAKAASAA